MSMLDLFSETLAEAQARLQANLDEGMACPCCQQYAKRYRRNLYAAPVRSMFALWRLMLAGEPGDFYHRLLFDDKNNDFALTRHWRLSEEKEKEEGDDKRTSGFWRLTPDGILFLRGRLSVKRKVVLYNDRVEGFEGEPIFILECLGKKFSYAELMAGIPDA